MQHICQVKVAKQMYGTVCITDNAITD